jgi:leucine-rich repeat protein SHOC2
MRSSHDQEIAAILHEQNGRPPICSFDKHGHLLSLNIADCKLGEVPTEIGELRYLRKLVLSNNPLRQLRLPAAMSTQTELYLLKVNRCELEAFPTNLPPRLKQLSADYNQISSLAGVNGGQSPLLEEISLFGNHLTGFPEELLLFKHLQILDLGNNLLTSLSPVIQHLQSLQKLNLTANKLEALPVECEALTALQALYLGNNAFKQLPDVLFSLHNLQELKLDGNQFQELSHKIGQLSNLHSLSLARNRLQALPLTVERLQHLHTLDLHSNELHILPPEIGCMSSLETLNLADNPLSQTTMPLHIGERV